MLVEHALIARAPILASVGHAEGRLRSFRSTIKKSAPRSGIPRAPQFLPGSSSVCAKPFLRARHVARRSGIMTLHGVAAAAR